ncbi:DUF433 domain-containing protein [Thermoflexibacter ruber]
MQVSPEILRGTPIFRGTRVPVCFSKLHC